MPRPGPRPYECVRRAWHSDRHQPMRGSLIQEIFRVVNEIHSSATKKNKEWQDKLPLVVLKAEEIMYSKANTEAEYMDLKTLWERTNDAINTIIRRDESSESGDLLQPCIEAALNLGCTPRKASRSQRNNSPRCYLSSTTQEATQTAVASKKFDTLAYDVSQMLTPNSAVTVLNPGPQFPTHYSNPVIHVNVASTHLSSDSCSSIHRDKPMPHEQMNLPPMSSCEFPTMPGNFALPWQNKSSRQFDPSQSSGAINPLYYSNNPSMAKSVAYQYPQGANHAAIMVSMLTIKEAKTDFLQNLLNSDNALDALDKVASGSLNFEASLENLSDMGCDLSLRLGPLPTHWNHENNSTQDASSSSYDRNRFCDPGGIRTGLCDCSSASSCRVRGFCFVSSESSSTPWSAAQINGVPRGKF